MDLVSILSLLFGALGVLVGAAGVAYGIHAKRQADAASKGAMLGADEAPALLPVRSNGGFNFMLSNHAKFPQFDVCVRVHDFSKDVVLDPTKLVGDFVSSDPQFRLLDLYPKQMHLPFFEIDLQQRDRARVNFFIQTRNASSTVEVVAIRDDGGPKIAFRQRFAGSREQLSIPADFPVVDRENPGSLFAEDKPTGKMYIKTPEGLKPAIPS